MTQDKLSAGRGQALERFILACRGVRKEIDVDIPIQQMMILAYLHLNGATRQADLCERLDMQSAAVSRHIRSLGSYHKQVGKEIVEKGKGLVISERDLLDARVVRCSLSQHAEAIMIKYSGDLIGLREKK